MDISNFYLACTWALACFMLMMPIGYLSFRFIEAPFLRLRRRYTIEAEAVEPQQQGRGS
jgi:peptidoglycan/LPS O-acetylase OafA/YrhL